MRVALIAAFFLAGSQFVAAQVQTQPGDLASAVLPSVDARPLISVLPAQPAIASVKDRDTRMKRLWIGSMAAMLGATSMDAATSWGKREGNGLLASSDGNFGMRGASIKFGMAAAVIIPQVLLRKHVSLRSKFMLGNFIEAGIFTGVSIHNLGVPASGRAIPLFRDHNLEDDASAI